MKVKNKLRKITAVFLAVTLMCGTIVLQGSILAVEDDSVISYISDQPPAATLTLNKTTVAPGETIIVTLTTEQDLSGDGWDLYLKKENDSNEDYIKSIFPYNDGENNIRDFTVPNETGTYELLLYHTWYADYVFSTLISFTVEETDNNDITTNFTDGNFRAEVQRLLGKSTIYDTDVSGILSLDLSGKNIASLAGIEYFTALTYLDCSDNELTTLSVASNTSLNQLQCYRNQLTALVLPNSDALEVLDCQYNQLTELNVSNNTKLRVLSFHNNQLTVLDVLGNNALTYLDCAENPLLKLDVSNNAGLITLICYDNNLTELDVSNNPVLEVLECYNNYMLIADDVIGWEKIPGLALGTTFRFYPQNTPVDNDITADFEDENFLAEVRKLLNKSDDEPIYAADVAEFTSLNVSNKEIASLAGIEHFTALTSLACDGNQLTALDVSANTELTMLLCDMNQLTALDVSANTKLTFLNCGDNKLTALDVSANTELIYLYFYVNQLKKVDVTQNTLLEYLDCRHNNMASIDNVIGWANSTALILDDSFIFDPQNTPMSEAEILEDLFVGESAADYEVDVDTGYIRNIQPEIDVVDFKAQFAAGTQLIGSNDTGYIGTGMRIVNEAAGIDITVIIKGDVTGEGIPGINDAQTFLEHLVGNNSLSGAYLQAAQDITGTEETSAIRNLRKFLTEVMK